MLREVPSGSIRWLALALGLVSGLLYAASIPKPDAFFLAWIALVPLILALAYLPPALYIPTGFIAGCIAATGRTYWISETLQLYGNLPAAIAFVTTALLILYMALYTAAFMALCKRLDFSSPLFAWAAAALWTLLEWAQNWMLSGFPWQLFGYSQYLNLPFVQWASISGIYGLSFVLVLFNAALAQALYFRRLSLLGLPLLLVIAIHAWGYFHLQTLDNTPAPTLRVGVVQGNISQDRKWKVNRLEWTTHHYASLARELAQKAPQEAPELIIFPETALPFYFDDPFYSPYRQEIRDLSNEIKIPLLVGSLEGRIGEANTPTYNRAFMLDTEGETSGFADKVHLVPFGEFLPFPEIFQYLEALTAESGQFAHGLAHRTIRLPNSDIHLGVFICYESIFPEISRTLTGLDVDFLVNTTNDAWFGHTAAPYQHFAMAIVRAVETGRSVVRAANTGISAVIAPSGRVQFSTELFETTSFVQPVALYKQQTLYTRYGNWILWCCGIVLVFIWIRSKKGSDG